MASATGSDRKSRSRRCAHANCVTSNDRSTSEEIEKSRVVKGYEFDRGQFVTFSAEELKALDVESSKVIDLERFVPRSDIDPVYLDSSYYLYPDGAVAVEALRVIGVAMAEAGVAGIGRLTLSRRERMVMVEPRGTGMALFTLRAANGRRNSAAPKAIPMPKWSRSPGRSSYSAAATSSQARTAIATKRRYKD